MVSRVKNQARVRLPDLGGSIGVFFALLAIVNFSHLTLALVLERGALSPWRILGLFTTGFTLLCLILVLMFARFGRAKILFALVLIGPFFLILLLATFGFETLPIPLVFLGVLIVSVLAVSRLLSGLGAGLSRLKRRHATWMLAGAYLLFFGPFLHLLFLHSSLSTLAYGRRASTLRPNPVYDVNRQGYRGQITSPVAGPQEPCYLFLGDSTTFGFGVRNDFTFASRLEQRLRQQGAPTAFCLNAGVNSAGLTTLAKRFEAYKDRRPAAVFIMAGLHFRETKSESTHRILPPQLLAFEPLARRAMGRMDGSSPVPHPEQIWAKNLEDLIDAILRQGSQPVLLIYPSSHLEPSLIQAQRALSQERQVPLIDLYAEFEDQFDALLLDGVHPNEKGHDRIAEAIAQWLAQNRPQPI